MHFIEDRQSNENISFMYDNIYFQHPEDDFDRLDGDGDDEIEDEEDELFDDEAEDIDDLNTVRYGDDLDTSDDAYDITNPDPDDDHLPEEELQ